MRRIISQPIHSRDIHIAKKKKRELDTKIVFCYRRPTTARTNRDKEGTTQKCKDIFSLKRDTELVKIRHEIPSTTPPPKYAKKKKRKQKQTPLCPEPGFCAGHKLPQKNEKRKKTKQVGFINGSVNSPTAMKNNENAPPIPPRSSLGCCQPYTWYQPCISTTWVETPACCPVSPSAQR